jgi:hypothetical protein
LKKLVLSAAAAAGLVLSAVAPASAATVSPQSVGQCQSGWSCAWNTSGYTGTMKYTSACNGATVSVTSMGGGLSAKLNRSNARLYLYSGGSNVAILGPGASMSRIGFDSMVCDPD